MTEDAGQPVAPKVCVFWPVALSRRDPVCRFDDLDDPDADSRRLWEVSGGRLNLSFVPDGGGFGVTASPVGREYGRPEC